MIERPNIHHVFGWVFLLMFLANWFGPINWYTALISWPSVGLTIVEFELAKRLRNKRFREQFKR